jgi:hypothetical protein
MIRIDLEATARDIPARLSCAMGTRVANKQNSFSNFDRGARLACGNFSPLPYANDTGLFEISAAEYFRTVGIVEVPPWIVDELRKSRGNAEKRAAHDDSRNQLARTLRAWFDVLPDTGWRLAPRHWQAAFTRQACASGYTTVDHATGRNIGLHLDSWDALAPRLRRAGSNRICINLGRSPRAFIFIAREASLFADDLLTHGIDIDNDADSLVDRFGMRSLARRYMEVFPALPVIRLTVCPGEAYIAPTENLIHDGMTQSGLADDLVLTIRGTCIPTAISTRYCTASANSLSVIDPAWSDP